MPVPQLSTGVLERIVGRNESPDNPVLQVISSKKIMSTNNTSDRYRLLVSDGAIMYSHVMLATQLNDLAENGTMDNLSVVQMNKYLCNVIGAGKRVLIVLDLTVLAPGSEVGQRLGNPQQFRSDVAGDDSTAAPSAPVPTPSSIPRQPAPNHGIRPSAPMGNLSRSVNPGAVANSIGSRSLPGPSNRSVPVSDSRSQSVAADMSGSSRRIHTIDSLTPYQNRWTIRARVTQKSNIRQWSNSRGEGRLFSVNLIDETGEIRATGFNEAVAKFYDLLEVNKVYYVSRATLKTANKQFTSVKNDYEMTFTNDTVIEPCTETTNLPTMTFEFVGIGDLEKKQPNTQIDVIGIVKSCADLSTVVGRQSQKEVMKRDLSLVDQTGMVVSLTLWGSEAELFDGAGHPVLAVKGAKLSDFGGRSLSVLSSSQVIRNPDIREAHILKGWWEHDGQKMDFGSYRGDNVGGSIGTGSNWKTFIQVKTENLGQGDKADYFVSKGTVMFLRKENCMYQACPTDQCNKKMVDQGNGLYRCEKCNKEFPNFKWRMILSVNIADHTDNIWVTCFQESAETIISKSATELGDLRQKDEAAFDKSFQDALFQSYIFRLRSKVESYNDESRLKTICMSVTPVDWAEYGKHLLTELGKLQV